MAKYRKIGQSLTPKDWLKYRPYKTFSTYDGYYLKLAKSAFDYLNNPKNEFRQIFQREHLKEAAVLVTCYFEDFINRIGLWEAFINKNLQLYGEALPFYPLDDYDPEYLNPEDFAYLLWHQLGEISQKSISPFGYPILDAADHFYEFFEALIEDAPLTDFYEEWLHIPSDIDFFELKNRLIWMAFQNYLIGPEFAQSIDKDTEEILEGEARQPSSFDPGKLLYGIQDDYIFKRASPWCAMRVPEWMAEVARCTDHLRNDIRKLTQRVNGMFLFQGYDQRNYHYEFIASKRHFAIKRESFDLDLAGMTPGSDLAVFSAVNWQGEWWLSGVYMGLGKAGKDLDSMRLDPINSNFHGWTTKQQNLIREMTDEMEQAFINYFGSSMVVFPNEKAMAEAMEAQNQWWNKYKTRNQKAGKEPSPYRKLLDERPSSYDRLKVGKGKIGAFFISGEGVLISKAIPGIIDMLQDETISPEDSAKLFFTFFHELDPQIAYHFAEQYPMERLIFPMFPGHDFVKKHFDFFLRYYNPNSFIERVPNLNLLPGQGM